METLLLSIWNTENHQYAWGREEIAAQTASQSHSPRLVHTTGPNPLLVLKSWVTWWQFKSDYACSRIVSDHQWCNRDRGGHCRITELTVTLTTAMGQRVSPSAGCPAAMEATAGAGLLRVSLAAPETRLGAALAASQDLTRRAALLFFSLFSHSVKIQLKTIAEMEKSKDSRVFMIQPKKNILE